MLKELYNDYIFIHTISQTTYYKRLKLQAKIQKILHIKTYIDIKSHV